jgi:hypothetical protein
MWWVMELNTELKIAVAGTTEIQCQIKEKTLRNITWESELVGGTSLFSVGSCVKIYILHWIFLSVTEMQYSLSMVGLWFVMLFGFVSRCHHFGGYGLCLQGHMLQARKPLLASSLP